MATKYKAGGAVTAKKCEEAFGALISAMRYMKKRKFVKPPLLDSDFVALGLKPPDTTPTTIPRPEHQATAGAILEAVIP